MSRLSILAAFVVIVSLPAAAQKTGADKPVFLVTDVAVSDDAGIDRDAARDALATRFGRLKGKIEVRSMAEAKASIDAAALSQMLGDASEDQLSKLEEYVKVDRIVFGRIAKVAGVTEIQVRVFNVAEGVAEVGFARRLKKDASPTMVLTLLDTLADSLLAWTLNTYTDGARSAEAEALAQKKFVKKNPNAEAPATSSGGERFSWLGAVGGAGLGLGVGAVGVVGYSLANGATLDDNDNLPILIAGATVGVIGAGAVIVDALTE